MPKRRQKGTGSVWQDKENSRKWHGEIQIGYNANGKPKKKRVTGTSAKEVKNKLEKIKFEQLNTESQTKSNITIPTLARQIADEKYNLNAVKASTYNRLIATIRIIEKSNLAVIPIAKLTENDIKAFFINQTHYSNSVLKKVYREISATLKRALKMNIISYNLCEDIPRPKSDKQTKKVSALTIDEQKALIESLNTDNKEPYRTMLLLSLFSGMRMGEICALHISDYDGKTISITKTLTRDEADGFIIGDTTKTDAGMRKLTVTPIIRTFLDKYIKEHYHNEKTLFRVNGGLATTNEVNSYYKRLIERYNIAESAAGYNQHQLRHTYATRCIESGMNAKVLQHKLGHHNITVTLNTYADVFAQFEDNEDEKFIDYMTSKGFKI